MKLDRVFSYRDLRHSLDKGYHVRSRSSFRRLLSHELFAEVNESYGDGYMNTEYWYDDTARIGSYSFCPVWIILGHSIKDFIDNLSNPSFAQSNIPFIINSITAFNEIRKENHMMIDKNNSKSLSGFSSTLFSVARPRIAL